MKKIVMFTSEFPGSGKTTGAEAIMQASFPFPTTKEWS